MSIQNDVVSSLQNDVLRDAQIKSFPQLGRRAFSRAGHAVGAGQFIQGLYLARRALKVPLGMSHLGTSFMDVIYGDVLWGRSLGRRPFELPYRETSFGDPI